MYYIMGDFRTTYPLVFSLNVRVPKYEYVCYTFN